MLPRGLDRRIDTFGPRPRACVTVVPPRSACQQLLNCDQCGTAAQTPRQKLCMGRAKHRKLKKAGTKTLVSLDKKLPSRRPPEHKRFREQLIAKEKKPWRRKRERPPGATRRSRATATCRRRSSAAPPPRSAARPSRRRSARRSRRSARPRGSPAAIAEALSGRPQRRRPRAHNRTAPHLHNRRRRPSPCRTGSEVPAHAAVYRYN